MVVNMVMISFPKHMTCCLTLQRKISWGHPAWCHCFFSIKILSSWSFGLLTQHLENSHKLTSPNYLSFTITYPALVLLTSNVLTHAIWDMCLSRLEPVSNRHAYQHTQILFEWMCVLLLHMGNKIIIFLKMSRYEVISYYCCYCYYNTSSVLCYITLR